MITAVTAFVPIPGHPRAEEEYRRLGDRLLAMDSKIPLLLAEGELAGCWLWQMLMERPDGYTWSVSDNPKKNSLAYHCVQAQKSAWLVAAAELDPTADVFAWLDYGIYHIPGVSSRIIVDFLERAANEKVIAIPGCWGKDYVYDDAHPCWRFAGGVWLVPREYVGLLDQAMRREYVRWFDLTKNISWEINCLARVEQTTDLPIWWYGPCDHDSSLFTEYKNTEVGLQ